MIVYVFVFTFHYLFVCKRVLQTDGDVGVGGENGNHSNHTEAFLNPNPASHSHQYNLEYGNNNFAGSTPTSLSNPSSPTNKQQQQQQQPSSSPYPAASHYHLDSLISDPAFSDPGADPNSYLSALDNNYSHGIFTRPPPKARLHFVDNLKTFLTVIVVVHHVCCSYNLGTGNDKSNTNGNGSNNNNVWYWSVANYNQSFSVFSSSFLFLNETYVVPLFFFISGFFTPTSFDRKGPIVFMEDKYRRLGVPFLLYYFALQPILIIIVLLLQHEGDHRHPLDQSTWPWQLGPGPLWFSAWLLVFNQVYAWVDHSSANRVNVPLPSLWKFLFVCLFLTLLQVATSTIAGGTFAFMPMTYGSLPFDVCFFYSGVVAARNNWLGGILQDDNSNSNSKDFGSDVGASRGRRWLGRLLWLALTVGTFVYFSGEYAGGALLEDSVGDDGTGTGSETKAYNDLHVREKTDYEDKTTAFCTLVEGAYVGVTCLLAIDLFRERFNFTGRWTLKIAETSYAVYVLHPFAVCLSTYLFQTTYESVTGETIFYANTTLFSTTKLENEDSWVWTGFVVSCVFSVVVSYFVCYWIREIPGMKRIL